MSQINEQGQKLTAEYWGGQDIFNDDLFKEAPYVPGVYLEHKKFKHVRSCLQRGVGQVAAGNATEIRYRAGNEFNPELGEGSLVVIDSEHLMRWTYRDPERGWEEARSREDGPAITRPYSTFWLNNQDGTAKPNNGLGIESVTFLDELAIYIRSLNWGVVAEQSKTQLIQPFCFSTIKLLRGGYIHTPSTVRRDSVLHGHAMRMPINIGEVKINPRLTIGRYGCSIDWLERVRSVGIVYPVSGGKEPKMNRKRVLGRLALPKLGVSHP